MATRMQQRRGTAAQWISTNSGDGPILEAGEIGFETDTGKFKIGNGSDPWVDLDYFIDESDIDGITGDYVLESTLGVANGVATLDANAKLTSSQLPDIAQVTVHAVADQAARLALSVQVGDIAIQSDNGQTYVLSATPASTNGNWSPITVADPFPTHDTDDLSEGTTNKYYSDTLARGAVSGGTGLDYNSSTGVFDIDSTVTTNDGSQTLTNKTIHTDNNSITVKLEDVDDITATALEVNTLDGITATTAELNILAGLTASTAELNILDGATLSVSELNVLDGITASTTELNYVDGVTSAIQTQIDGKISASSTDTLTNKTLSYTDNTITVQVNNVSDLTASAAEINTLDGITASTAELNLLDGVTASTAELNILDGVTATTAELNILDGATLDVTELNYLDGVTSSVQTQLDAKLDKSGGTMTGDLTLAGAPTQSLHAATKAYVDGVTEGLHIHEAVVAATTANIDLSTDLENGDVVDGVTLVTGNRVLVKNQSTTSQNGIYVVQASGAAVRAADFDSPAEIDSGDFVFVNSGTSNGDTGWVQINTVGTVGSDPIQFTQFSGAGTFLAGTGLDLDGNVFSIDTATTVDVSTAQTLTNKTISAVNNTLTIATTDLTDVTATAAELNILDGATLDVNELNVLDGMTASTAELNILDGVTATTAEINTLAGITSTTAELNILDGVTASAAEINVLDGITVTSSDLNQVFGLIAPVQTQLDDKAPSASPTFTGTVILPSTTSIGTVTDTEIGYLDGVTSAIQTQIDGKISSSSSDTLTNKTIALGSNTVSGTIAQFNTAVTDADFATLAGTETLTNKTVNLSSNTLTGTLAQFNTALSDADFATLAGTETLTNKTLTSPYINAGVNNQFGSYTLALTDNGKVVTINNASAVTLTVPTNASVAFPIGAQILVTQTGNGQITVSSSATLRATPGAKLRTLWSTAALVKIDTDTWVLSGDTIA